ncbi:MAG: hypothetical protein L3J39_19595 [Verrucomicrobiales bacterium]|nr:hypothetical protein [Verrucomicrobiales bacterium]
MKKQIPSSKASPHKFILRNVTPFHGAIRMGDWKLIHNGHVRANATSADEKETWKLFNIKLDASEKNDLSKKRPKVFARLKAKLDQLENEAVEANIAPNRPIYRSENLGSGRLKTAIMEGLHLAAQSNGGWKHAAPRK